MIDDSAVGAPLRDKRVLITGASRGIGAATARTVHRDGGTVVVHYGANKAAADALAAELGRERVHLVQGDLTDPTETRRVWEESVRATGPINVLVNNAGAWIASPIDDDTGWTDGMGAHLALNLIAPVDLTRYAIAHFRDHGGRAVINVASRSAHRGDDAEHPAYGAAKGAIAALPHGKSRHRRMSPKRSRSSRPAEHGMRPEPPSTSPAPITFDEPARRTQLFGHDDAPSTPPVMIATNSRALSTVCATKAARILSMSLVWMASMIAACTACARCGSCRVT